MAKVITGSGRLVSSRATMDHVATHVTYLSASRQYLAATEILAAAKGPAMPLGNAAGQCLELALKAYLLWTGMTEAELLRDRGGPGHSIAECWRLSVGKGLPLDDSLPSWAGLLERGHDTPLMFRYSKSNTGIALPPRDELLQRLTETIDLVAGVVEG